MPGYDSNRFLDLTEREAKHLNCSICLSIFDDPVISGCGHTFCSDCLNQWIISGQKECPECRIAFRLNKTDHNLNQSLIVRSEFEFIRDFKSKTIINELKTFCDFRFRGCKQVIEFGSLEAHLKQCEHRLCKTCGIAFKKDVDHNCTELLIEDRNIWREEVVRLETKIKGSLQKYNELEVLHNQQNYELNETKLKNNELTKNLNQLRNEFSKLLNDLSLTKVTLKANETQISEQQKQYNKLNKKYSIFVRESKEKAIKTSDSNKQLNVMNSKMFQQLNEIETEKSKLVMEMSRKEEWTTQLYCHWNGVVLHTSHIMFGTHSSTNYNNIWLDSDKMFFILRDSSDIKFNIKFICITKMLFCSNSVTSVIFLKLGRETSKDIRHDLQMIDRTNGWFDSSAEEPSETYVTLEFRFEACATLLRLAINTFWYKYNSLLKCQQIDEDTARQMLAMARK